MKKRSTAAASRRQPTGKPRRLEHDNPLLPPAIPGIRVAYIGQDAGAVEVMRSYWHARRAAFRQLTLAGEPAADGLEPLLEWADIVVHSEDGISATIWRRIQTYCDRAEKPLLAVDGQRASGLADALVGWCPLQSSHS